jgi:hypothetical protein
MKITPIIMTTRAYWRLYPVWQKFVFRFNNRLYQDSEGLKGSSTNCRIFWMYFRNIALGIIVAAFTITFIEGGSSYFASQLPVETHSLHDLITAYTGIKFAALDNSVYKDLAALIAVLASIYFATISIVASTAYLTCTSQTRELIWAERGNKYYFTFLVSLLGFLLILSGIKAYGYDTGSVIFLYTFLLVLVAVLSFIYTNIQLFAFFSLITLIDRKISPDICSFIENVTPKGIQWGAPAVQRDIAISGV